MMKKVTAFVASPRKQATYSAILEFEQALRAHAKIDFEIVFLKDVRLEYCRGCRLCFDSGEDRCPIHDDRDAIIQKIEASDGVVFAAPNYAFGPPAPLKNLFDRLAFLFHRPRFFRRACTAIVAQAFFGGGTIVKYLGDMGKNFGFSVTKGCVLKTLDPMTEKAFRNNSRKIQKAAARFAKALASPGPFSPSLFRLMMFRMARSAIRSQLDESFFDYRWYREKGWFTSDYYYEVTIGPLKKLMGRFFDFLGRRMG